jgi:hypothetical protein
MAWLTICCGDPHSNKDDTSKHALRKFNVKSSTSEHASARFFLLAGGYSSSKSERVTVRMYYQNCNKEYQFLEVPLSQVKVKIDTVEVPYITLHNIRECNSMYFAYDSYLVIHCKESEFQPEININDLK